MNLFLCEQYIVCLLHSKPDRVPTDTVRSVWLVHCVACLSIPHQNMESGEVTIIKLILLAEVFSARRVYPNSLCNIRRRWQSPLWTFRFVATNSPDLNPVNSNLGHNSAKSLPDRSARCERVDAASDWWTGRSGVQWRRCSAVQASPSLRSDPLNSYRIQCSDQRRTFWILAVTKISQNV